MFGRVCQGDRYSEAFSIGISHYDLAFITGMQPIRAAAQHCVCAGQKLDEVRGSVIATVRVLNESNDPRAVAFSRLKGALFPRVYKSVAY